MKLKISNHSSFNLKGTGRNPSGKFNFDGHHQQRDKTVLNVKMDGPQPNGPQPNVTVLSVRRMDG